MIKTLKKLLLFLLPLASQLALAQATAPPQINGWRVHLPYNNANSITEVEGKIYVGTNSGIFVYDDHDKSIERLTKINGFTDIRVSALNYNNNLKILVVGYQNGNIDLVHDGNIYNMGEVLRSEIVGDKNIYHINFQDDFAYLSTGIGLIKINLRKREVADSYTEIGPSGDKIEIFASAIFQGNLFVATKKEIRMASLSSPNVRDYHFWNTVRLSKHSRSFAVFQNKLYAEVDSTIMFFDGNSWVNYLNPGNTIVSSLNVNYNKLISSTSSEIIVEDQSNQKKIYPQNFPGNAIQDGTGKIWYTSNTFGLIKLEPSTLELSLISPNAPIDISLGEMKVLENELWVSSTTENAIWEPLFNNKRFYSYINSDWKSYNELKGNGADSMVDLNCVAIDPITKTKYFGSFGRGLLEFKNDQEYKVYNESNSSLQWWVVNADYKRLQVAGLEFDENGYLWVSNYGAPKPLSVKTPDGKWIALSTGNVLGADNELARIVIDQQGQKWIQAPEATGLLVYNHGATVEDPTDDKYKLFKAVSGNGALPSDEVLSLAVDLDGEIWVGTSKGLTVFYNPSSAFEENYDAQQILVGSGSTTSHLLGEEQITAIAVDAGNRKWIGTRNGAWLVSPDGTKVIANFTEKNSPLISNNIIEIAINHESGEVFFGTDRGIISYMGTATKGDSKHKNVYAYPNPVTEDYDGPIAIRGLVNNANVKITDISGTLIYETTANGGLATWNGKNFSGEKAHTGVYLIFSANEDGTETNVAKLLLINKP